ncbi:anaphase promoting complex subunit bimA [Aspergillus clavatus NRRL 1]|uniref:20S cyclosome subunit (BimA/Nuc2/Cdc27), putative n=1 Tax=Aspergillus clavatus (strain ATCC 1007 / CBS 513.65 / DSM 816 / NCTC 3887 / NRRL 1 / QM 1276 / 107) TaxID=344612 RepID=A1CSS5_ASPCL|nr:20S cyclosome subunit (BimA/Nuc2/Cdc27), putative [Aspergillus clavatus NRRL 1]EAW06362.1 20S cyclosome subunit (BimA/Nuc2/Cdc27), putative [Aspergillus clavatus NRRL 1]
MSPSISHISSQLRQLIYYHLDNNLARNALFLAGRLHAYEPRTAEASYLLALCHLQNGQVKAAYDYSRNFGSRGTHLGCSYVYAQACLDLGKYLDGVTALERSKSLWSSKNHWSKHSETRRQHLPDAAAVLCLLGKLWHAHKDFNKAVECYVESLKLNPFMWDAFQGLCETGVNVRVSNIYKLNPELLAVLSTSTPEEVDPIPDKAVSTNGPLQSQPNINPSSDPFASTTSRSDSGTSHGSSALWEKLNGSTVSVASSGAQQPVVHEGTETPSGPSSGSDEIRLANGINGVDAAWEPPLAPARKNRTIGGDYPMDPPPKMKPTGIRPRTRTRAEPEEHIPGQTEREAAIGSRVGDRKRTVSGQVAHSSTAHPVEPGAPQRRSVRLFNQIKPTTSKLSGTALGIKDGRELKKVKATGAKGRTTSTTVGRVVSSSRRHASENHDGDGKESRSVSSAHTHAVSKGTALEKSKEVEALTWLLELFSKLASGYFALNRYRCQEAIQIFNSLSQGQRETPWVLAQIGRAYYEQAMYSEAEKYFYRVKTIAPSRLEDMEIYSTVLWHLKNDVELAYLAHELMEIDRLSPQAWCAIGNSFSHQRDHDQALKCFKRATQLDPQFAYGFTLQGHEYVANEEYDKALDAYRHGISADSRHYNAWYGLGTVYDKMGKLDFAEQHFRNAASINPTNAVLICCIGLVLEKMNNPKAALVQYGRACTLAPHSVLARFRKARVLMKLQELKLALSELKILKDMAPDEANVHYLLGKLYKMLHDKANAIKHFTTALNLDPKAAQYIKDAMESLDDDEDDDEDIA